MERILVVLRGPLDAGRLRQVFTAAPTEPHELAVCHVLPREEDTLVDSLRAARHVTAALRAALGEGAENVAVFVATDQEGDRVEDCARAWGATSVRP